MIVAHCSAVLLLFSSVFYLIQENKTQCNQCDEKAVNLFVENVGNEGMLWLVTNNGY